MNTFDYTPEHKIHIERGWIDDEGRCIACGREMYYRVAEAARRIQHTEQLIADPGFTADTYLQLTEQLVAAKRALRLALAATNFMEVNPHTATFWLIERGQAEGQMPTVWWTGRDEGRMWTTYAVAAHPFLSEADAQRAIDQRSQYEGPKPSVFGRPTEHSVLSTEP